MPNFTARTRSFHEKPDLSSSTESEQTHESGESRPAWASIACPIPPRWKSGSNIKLVDEIPVPVKERGNTPIESGNPDLVLRCDLIPEIGTIIVGGMAFSALEFWEGLFPGAAPEPGNGVRTIHFIQPPDQECHRMV